MSTQPIIPVILSGGSGTRLWPSSRDLTPKQLLPLVTDRTLLQETLTRLEGLPPGRLRQPIVVCNADHRFLIAEQLRGIGAKPQAIVLEPAGRNTAPAVAVAALVAEQSRAKLALAGAEAPILLVLPADHVILDRSAFAAAVDTALEAAANGKLVTFGVVPDRPETGYGYILTGRSTRGWSAVERFVEKPDLATAEQYLASGRYLWNSGMFMFSAGTYLSELERHAPEMVAKSRAALAAAERDADFVRLGREFLDCPADSIDYAVMEKTRNAAVVPLAAGWSDVGSWSALHAVLDKDDDGNVLRGDVIVEACTNSFIAASGRLVAAVGVDGIVIVETPDAVLVVSAEESQRVKKIVDALRKAGRREVRSSIATKSDS